MKLSRLALIITVIAMVLILVLSFSVCGETESGDGITPVDGVYEVFTKDQLISVFDAIEKGTIPATASIKLT